MKRFSALRLSVINIENLLSTYRVCIFYNKYNRTKSLSYKVRFILYLIIFNYIVFNYIVRVVFNYIVRVVFNYIVRVVFNLILLHVCIILYYIKCLLYLLHLIILSYVSYLI